MRVEDGNILYDYLTLSPILTKNIMFTVQKKKNQHEHTHIYFAFFF